MSGKVITKSSQLVRQSDVLTFPQGSFIRVVKILFLADRRGPSPEAQLLFEDLSPIEKQQADKRESVEFQRAMSNRERGGGRPTKDNRRAIDRLMRRD
jgi:ribosome-associated heat shock protein Hsp15